MGICETRPSIHETKLDSLLTNQQKINSSRQQSLIYPREFFTPVPKDQGFRFVQFLSLTFFIGHVLIPKGAYNGQKLIKLVKRNTPAKTNNTIPKVPVIVPVKYNAAIIAAMMNRIIRSELPMFFFMTLFLVVQFLKDQNNTRDYDDTYKTYP